MSSSSGRGRPPAAGGRGSVSGAPQGQSSEGRTAERTTPSLASGSARRTPSVTQSLLPSRSSSAVRPSGARTKFRPKQPPARPGSVSIKPDPDGASPAGSPAPNISPAISPAHSRPNSPVVARQHGPRRSKHPEMVASGPFAQGSGAASRKDHSRTSYAAGGASTSGLRTTVSSSTIAASDESVVKKDREEYSDQEGGEYIDLDDVGNLDELAPKTIPRVKREDERAAARRRSQTPRAAEHVEASRASSVSAADKDVEAREADALDLSASEEEELMDDLVDDFVARQDGFDDDPDDKMYLFQFPPLFPHFVRPSGAEETSPETGKSSSTAATAKARRSVAFADDTLGGGGAAGALPSTDGDKAAIKIEADERDRDAAKQSPPEGQIGRLDVYRDGRVMLTFGDKLVMEVTGGAQANFLQQVMILDAQHARATTLGEVERKFVVAPEISSMLADADRHEEDKDRDPENMEGII